jgi:hypothetical protein
MPLGLRILIVVALARLAFSQTTQGVLRGNVLSLRDGSALAGCRIAATHNETALRRTALTDTTGAYVLSELSPGTYVLRAECDGYQAQEFHMLELRVAAQLLIRFAMRPLDQVWEDQRRSVLLPGRSVLMFYGPDVDTSRTGNFEGTRGAPGALEATVSQVIDQRLLWSLPLAGRDAYTMLVTQPGVTSDATTTRSLGLSVNGQRPSASHFLLDGLENNNALVTGPLSPLPPEALGEYRITTNNFSAEYGGTSGFLANSVTRSGTNEWHGAAYGYGRKSGGERRLQPGLVIGGPLHRPGWFVSGAFDLARFDSDAQSLTWPLPTQRFIDGLREGSIARDLLTRFRPPRVDGPGLFGNLSLTRKIEIDQTVAVPRVDWAPRQGDHRVFARLAAYRLTRPDFVASPYPGFGMPLKRRTESLGGGWTAAWSPRWTNELRGSLSRDLFSAERPRPEVPWLGFIASDELPLGLVLPGTRTPLNYRNRTRDFEIVENLGAAAGSHLWKAGFGIRRRHIGGLLGSYRDGRFIFEDARAFADDSPATLDLALARNNPVQPQLANVDREYSVLSWYGFVQDNWRPATRLALSFGLRYERPGAPAAAGPAVDQVLVLGAGASPGEQIAGAVLGGATRLYGADTNDWAVRLGATYALRENARTVLRASYGIFYDRVFDNVWQTVRNNSVLQLNANLPSGPLSYLDFPALLESLPSPLPVLDDFPEVTLFADRLASPRVHSGLVGVEHLLGRSWEIEANLLASSGRRLLTTDRWNRQASVPGDAPPSLRRFNNHLPDLLYRANQGRSSYRGMSVLLRRRSRGVIFQASYTLSHAKDNQSDPVLGDFFDLGFTGGSFTAKASFTRQFDPGGDWGNADFDQRHNFVAFAIAPLPGPLRGWEISGLAAVRSGFPFTVESSEEIGLLHNPADLVAPDRVWTTRRSENGGVRLLDPTAFRPAGERLGNSGRNTFHGPGLFNIDAALSRRFRASCLGETGALGFRLETFNLLNHANLGNPVASLEAEDFGIAYYRRDSRPNAFRILGPLAEAGRHLQFSVRVEF